MDIPLGRSKEELITFLNIAERQHPALVPVILGYLDLASRSESEVAARKASPPPSRRPRRPKEMHLFDLLREKTFFPQNSDLAKFAERVLPHMRTYRFDKMSKSDIAARIIEYIEDSDPRNRETLESSMREALADMAGRPTKEVERRSFLSKWERIIKGVE
jgi:hypothetical protein